MFQSLFSFNGRIRRTEYGISFIIYSIFDLIIRFGFNNDEVSILYIGYLPVFWFIFAQGAKRCHDMNKNGFWQLIPFFVIGLIFVDGDPGENEYGVNPKGLTYGESYADVKESQIEVVANPVVDKDPNSGYIDLNKH
jgi:uncharacterized membrane protein YhaH (DUF805 family)